MVLGGLLLVVIVLYASCSGGSKPKTQGVGLNTPAPTASASPSAEPEPSFVDPTGATDQARPAPSDVLAASAAAGATRAAPTAPVNVAAADGQCADADVQLTPVPGRTTAQRGTSIEIRFRMKNTSARACSRDVGADVQELYIKQGASKIWSSDTCGLAKGSKIEPLAPGVDEEHGFVTWNGQLDTKCLGGSATGPAPEAGEYQLYGRLGAKISAPVKLILT
jgi:hypothetical protein